MCKISEGDTKFTYTTKLVPTKDLGSICSSQHPYMFQLCLTKIGGCLRFLNINLQLQSTDAPTIECYLLQHS